MSQHDYVLANQSGSSFRSDLNNALAAIVSNNSGATEPATMYAYQWWADTTTGLLKIRNAANSAWVTVGTLASTNLGLLSLAGGTMTGALLAAVGSVGAPGVAFSGDTDSGFYRVSSNTWGLVANGTEYLRISTAGITMLGTGASTLCSGTTAQRPTPATGMVRYNSTTSKFEGYYASSWDDLALFEPTIAAKTANYTTTASDDIIYADASGGAFTLTLHTPTTNQTLTFVRTDDTLANAISFSGTISGETDWKMHTKNESYKIQYSTSLATWRLINHNTEFFKDLGVINITAVTSNPTKGTTPTDKHTLTRRGKMALLQFNFEQSVAGTAGTGDYLFNLPSGMTIDTTYMQLDTTAIDRNTISKGLPAFGLLYTDTGPTTGYVSNAIAYTSSNFRLITFSHYSSSGYMSSSFWQLATTVGWNFSVEIPIANWKA